MGLTKNEYFHLKSIFTRVSENLYSVTLLPEHIRVEDDNIDINTTYVSIPDSEFSEQQLIFLQSNSPILVLAPSTFELLHSGDPIIQELTQITVAQLIKNEIKNE